MEEPNKRAKTFEGILPSETIVEEEIEESMISERQMESSSNREPEVPVSQNQDSYTVSEQREQRPRGWSKTFTEDLIIKSQSISQIQVS